jgi:hypothetical protein
MEREEAINAVSGAVAGLVTAVFVCPLDVLKTRLQVSWVPGPGLWEPGRAGRAHCTEVPTHAWRGEVGTRG